MKMNHAYYLCTIIILNSIYYVQPSKVIWLPNSNFNLANNFKDKKLPCSKQTVIFPESVMNSVDIEAGISVSQLVLPIDGELVFGNTVIEFGPDENSNCTSMGNTFYMENSMSSWTQPDVWSSTKFNEATPDAERIPCFDDVIEFPENSQFSIVLPDQTQHVSGIKIAGQNFDEEQFFDYIYLESEEAQQFILNKYDDKGVIIRNDRCRSLAGCPCQEKALNIDCLSKFCKKLECVDPIQPIGHCCKICGGVIVFDIDQSFDMQNFKELVENVIARYGADNLVYHIGRLQLNKIQLVVVDKGDYSGSSAQVVNAIGHKMESHLLRETQISGSPLDISGLGGRIFVSVFFVVIAVIGAIYLYYYKLIDIRFPTIGLSGMILRFDQRTESVVSLTRRDSGVGISGVGSRAFRNPLYNSKREIVKVEESVMDD